MLDILTPAFVFAWSAPASAGHEASGLLAVRKDLP